MKKKDNFFDIQINKGKKNRKRGNLAGLFLAFLYLLMAEIGFFLMFQSVFTVDYKKSLFFGSAAVICFMFVLLYAVPSKIVRLSLLMGVLALWALCGFLLWDNWEAGFYAVLDSIIFQFNYYYNTAWVMDRAETATAAQNAEFLAFCMVPVVLILGAGIVRKFRWMIVASVMLIPMAGAMLVGQIPPVLPILLMLCVLLAALAGKQARIAGFTGKYAALAMIGVVLPVALISGLLLPSVNRFYEKNKVIFSDIKEYFNQEIWPFVENIGEHLPFGGNGSSVDGSLARGEFEYDGTKELRVTIDYQPSEALYLRGFIGDSYTGKKWETADGEAMYVWAEEQGWTIENPDEIVANMSYELLEQCAAYARECHMTLERVHASRKYAYLPYYSFVSDDYLLDGDGAVRGLSNERSEISYYLVSNEDIRSFKAEQMKGSVLNEELPEFLEEYETYVYSQYLDYPEEELPRLTQQCKDNPMTDIWQIRDTIVATLDSMAIYDIHTEAFPPDAEFTEYFLYEKKTGYCVHFATAATLMFRMYGIPARYVTGYIAPANTFFDNGDGTYTAELMDDMTHAWVEIFTDLGWVPVEVTPPYVSANWGGQGAGENAAAEVTPMETPDPTASQEMPETVTVTPEAVTETPEDADLLGNMEDGQDSDEGINATVTMVPEAEDGDAANDEDGKGNIDKNEFEERSLPFKILVLLSALLLLFTAVTVINAAVRIIVRSVRFNSSDYNSDVRYIYRYLYKALMFDRFTKEVRVSDPEFSHYLTKRYPRIRKEDTEVFVKQVLRANYSSDALTRVECMQARNFYRSICREISRRNGVIRRIQFRLFCGF